MALTKVSGGILDPGINVAGIVTATGFDGPFTGGSSKNITAGIITATGFDLNGNGDISGNLVVGGNLTANGDFTTLNTTLREVELLRVESNSSAVAGIITQSGSGDILNLYDGSTEVFSVKDGGSVRVGDNATYSANTGADDLVIGETTGQHGMTILTGNNSSSINFADSAAVNPGAITYQHNGTNYMLFRVAGGEKVRILADGKVGIGTFAPLQKLHVADDTSANIYIETKNGTTGSTAGIYYKTSSSTASGFFKTGIVLEDDGTGYARGKLHILQNNVADSSNATLSDSVVVFHQDGKVGIGTNAADANLTVHADAADQTAFTVHADMGTNNNRTFNLKTPATDSGSEPFVIHTANALSVQIDSTEEFRINDGGLVGIGTETPATKLHVTTTSASSTPLTLERTHNNNVIIHYKNPTLNMYAGLAGEGLGWGVGDSPDLGNPNNIQLMVNSTGRIGIGTIAPETNLTIAKNATNQTVASIPTVRLTNLDTTAVASDIVGSYEFFSKDVHSLNKVTGFMRNTPTDAGVNYDLSFGTIKTSDSNAVERLRIKADGKVGIGSTVPTQHLDIRTGTHTFDPFIKFGKDGNYNPRVQLFRTTGGSPSHYGAQLKLETGFFTFSNSGAANLGSESYVERIRIASDGKVGIGTDNPGHMLDIFNSAGSDCLKLNVSTAAGGSTKQNAIRFSVDDSVVAHMGVSVDAGRLISGSTANDFCLKGLGANNILFATNSLERLRIDSDGRALFSRGGLTASRNIGTKTGEIQVANAGNSSAISIIGYSNDVGGPHLMFGKSRAGNATGSTILQDGDRLGEIAFCGADGNDIDSFGAAIKAFVDGTPGANDMPGRLSFFTTLDGYSSSTERMVIKNDGKIGIGTDSPGGAQVRIHRDGLDKILQQWGGNQGSTAGQRFIELYSPSNDDLNDYFRFQTGNAVKFRIDSTNALCISSASKIGIGTDTPDTPLHIYANDAQQITVERAAATNSAIRYRNTVASMYAGLTSNATGFAIDNNDDLGVDPMFFVERSTGHVGINQIPTDYPLEVKQKSADGGALRLRDSASNFRYLDFDVTGALTQITARSNLSHGRIDIGTLSQYGRQTRLYIHSDGNVGIATNSPNTELEVFDEGFANITIHSARTSGNIGGIDFRKGGTATGIQTAQYFVNTSGEHFFHSQGSEKLKIASDGLTTVTGGLNVKNSANTTIKILDSSGDPDSYGYFRYNNGNDSDDTLIVGVDGGNTQGSSHIRFYVDGTSTSAERFRIDNSGNATIKDGNLVIGTSGHGIDFSATGDEGSLGSELLDDYESGTYTPTITLGSGSVTSTTSGTLSYVKIGRLINLFGRLHFQTSTNDVTSLTISLPIGNTSGVAYDTSSCMQVIRSSGGEPAGGIRMFRTDTNATVMKMQNANGQNYGYLGTTTPHINVNHSYFCD